MGSQRVGHDWVTELNWMYPVELLQILKDDAVKVLHSICQQIWKTQQWPQGWKRSVFIPVLKKGNTKKCSNYHTIALISFQFSSVTQSCPTLMTPWISVCQASLPVTNYQSSLKLTSIESVLPSSHLILGCPLLLLPPIPPSTGVFSNESTLRMRWPKYWSFSFIISPSNEHPGLISFRMDWLDLFAVQGTLKSLLQHHSSKASILRCPAFFTVQLSHPYISTGKMTRPF